MTPIETARQLGREFAEYLNDSEDRDQWDQLEDQDDIPGFDYVLLKANFGKVTSEMLQEYRVAFNEHFIPGNNTGD